MTQVTILTDEQKALLDALVSLRQRFLDSGVSISKAEIANWLAGIDAVTDLAKWRAYEKKSALLLIECMIAILRRLA